MYKMISKEDDKNIIINIVVSIPNLGLLDDVFHFELEIRGASLPNNFYRNNKQKFGPG